MPDWDLPLMLEELLYRVQMLKENNLYRDLNEGPDVGDGTPPEDWILHQADTHGSNQYQPWMNQQVMIECGTLRSPLGMGAQSSTPRRTNDGVSLERGERPEGCGEHEAIRWMLLGLYGLIVGMAGYAALHGQNQQTHTP